MVPDIVKWPFHKGKNPIDFILKKNPIVKINGSLLTLNNSESNGSDLCGWDFNYAHYV